jgi:uncharacterized membrane protein (DUF4010 family)
MYALGAYLAAGNATAAIVVGGVVAVLLHWKQPLHRFVDKIGERDIHAMMQFVLIALVILPVLPDQTYGPYEVLNPREIWRVVVLIVGIGLTGYVAYTPAALKPTAELIRNVETLVKGEPLAPAEIELLLAP